MQGQSVVISMHAWFASTKQVGVAYRDQTVDELTTQILFFALLLSQFPVNAVALLQLVVVIKLVV